MGNIEKIINITILSAECLTIFHGIEVKSLPEFNEGDSIAFFRSDNEIGIYNQGSENDLEHIQINKDENVIETQDGKIIITYEGDVPKRWIFIPEKKTGR